MRTLIPSLLLLAVATGCGTHVAFLPTNSPPHALAAKDPDSVQIFTTSRPDRSFVEVGIVESQQESMYSTASEQDVFRELRAEGARHGCDGLVLLGSMDRVGASVNQYGGAAKTLRGYRATCIVWSENAGPSNSAQAGQSSL